METRGFMFNHKDKEWKTERAGLSQKQQDIALGDNKKSEKQAAEEFCEDVKEGESDIDVTKSQLKDSLTIRNLYVVLLIGNTITLMSF